MRSILSQRLEISLLLTMTVIEVSFLFAYLSIPALQRRLKSVYLPFAVLWATIGPLLGIHLGLLQLEFPRNDATIQLVFWQSIPLLFIPLVVVAWQYQRKILVLFCSLTALLDLGPLLLWWSSQLEPRTLILAVSAVMTRTFAFFLAGNMILNLVRIQRQQRLELTQANERLARYASTLEQLTISRERNRLARELHDVMAHTLSGVAVELEGVRSTLRTDPDQAMHLVNHSLAAVREGLSETRRALQELRAKPLEDLGLGLAVSNLVDSVSGRLGIDVSLAVDPDLGDYSPDVQQCVYRITQEALANVENHAQASRVWVSLGRENGRLRLVVEDNGRGFDLEQPGGSLNYGLRGMRERAEMIGASFNVETQPGAGTRIVLEYRGVKA